VALTKGDVVLVPFPFTNLQQTKLRPAVVLWANTNGQDVTLCFVSSQDINNLNLGEFVLSSSDPDFLETGLKVDSKVRVTRLVTVERKLITRRLGKLSISQLQQLNVAMIQAFQL
jgi:mRNA interferase MazF